MILKKGSRGTSVKLLQRYLGIKIDGIFGQKTENYVIEFQKTMGLKPDGIVGKKTWDAFRIASTDLQEHHFKTDEGLVIHQKYLDADEYINEVTEKQYIFLHHTGGWDNPFKTVKDWNDDDRGCIGTEFVIGGQSIRGNKKHDGVVVQAIPEGFYAWHLGTVGKRSVHTNSVGIELNNFGQIKNGRVWTGAKVNKNQIHRLKTEFRGFIDYHKYSDDQLESARLTLKYIADRDNIDLRDGLVKFIRKKGIKAFEWQREAYYGTIKGLWTHTNVRKDKFDCFPQQELIDMLLTL